jgi:hypothetical protein
MKVQVTPRIPVRSVGAGGIVVTLANGVLTISNAVVEPTAVNADGPIPAGSRVIAISKNAPALTLLTLPSVQLQGGTPLLIVDWSTAVNPQHEVRLTPFGTETVLQKATFSFFSTAQQLGGALLYPSKTLNGWYQAP